MQIVFSLPFKFSIRVYSCPFAVGLCLCGLCDLSVLRIEVLSAGRVWAMFFKIRPSGAPYVEQKSTKVTKGNALRRSQKISLRSLWPSVQSFFGVSCFCWPVGGTSPKRGQSMGQSTNSDEAPWYLG